MNRRLFTIWDIVNTLNIEHIVTAMRQLSYGHSAFMHEKERIGGAVIMQVCVALEKCEKPLMDMGFKTSSRMIYKFLDSARRNMVHEDWTGMQFSERCHAVFSAIQCETVGVKCLKLEDGNADYFEQKHPFGEEVSKIFPEFSEDIEEAYNCFAFERYTACVFHAGRAMELAVPRLAKKVKAGKCKPEWQPYLTAINLAIGKMPFKQPKQKEKRSHYSEASSYLFNFKEAWRNKTMHPKKTYTKKEAEMILSSTRQFLKVLSERLFA